MAISLDGRNEIKEPLKNPTLEALAKFVPKLFFKFFILFSGKESVEFPIVLKFF